MHEQEGTSEGDEGRTFRSPIEARRALHGMPAGTTHGNLSSCTLNDQVEMGDDDISAQTAIFNLGAQEQALPFCQISITNQT